MAESKIEITHRLTQEGRWAEASAYRDKVRRERRQAGDTRAVAAEKAWEAMAQEFPRLDSATAPNGQLDVVPADDSDMPSGLPVGDCNFEEDVRWAWNHIGETVSPQDCRSGAAWVLHRMAIEKFDQFMVIAARSIGLRGAKAREKALKDREDRDRQFALLDSIKRSFAVPEGERATKGS